MLNFLTQMLLDYTSRLLGLVDYAFLSLKIFGPIQPKFFSKGYGDVDAYLKRRDTTIALLNPKAHLNMLPTNGIDWGRISAEKHITIQDGRFLSPVAKELPPESAYSNFKLVRPINFDEVREQENGSVYILMLPATGEMSKAVRLSIARHLAMKHGWCSVILTAPYYAERKPRSQKQFFINSVKDILSQAQGIIEESVALSAYLLAKSPKAKVCFTGFSFGAAMAGCASAFALKAGVDGKRLACAAYVGSASPSVLADGVLESCIRWESLQRSKNEDKELTRKQLFEELAKTQLDMIIPPEENRIAVVKAYSMKHDVFIREKYAREFQTQMQQCLNSSIRLHWLPGGHVFAAVTRPYFQTKLLEETIGELLEQ